MVVIVHYGNRQAILRKAVNLSVADAQGLVIEFGNVKDAAAALLNLEKEKFETKIVNDKLLSPQMTGFSAFEESQK